MLVVFIVAMAGHATKTLSSASIVPYILANAAAMSVFYTPEKVVSGLVLNITSYVCTEEICFWAEIHHPNIVYKTVLVLLNLVFDQILNLGIFLDPIAGPRDPILNNLVFLWLLVGALHFDHAVSTRQLAIAVIAFVGFDALFHTEMMRIHQKLELHLTYTYDTALNGDTVHIGFGDMYIPTVILHHAYTHLGYGAMMALFVTYVAALMVCIENSTNRSQPGLVYTLPAMGVVYAALAYMSSRPDR